jgi:hypothetical protein
MLNELNYFAVNGLGGSIQFLKKWKIHDLDAYFWIIITC